MSIDQQYEKCTMCNGDKCKHRTYKVYHECGKIETFCLIRKKEHRGIPAVLEMSEKGTEEEDCGCGKK